MSTQPQFEFSSWKELVVYANTLGFAKQLWALTMDIKEKGKPDKILSFESDEQAKLFFEWIRQIKVNGKLQFAKNAVDKVVITK